MVGMSSETFVVLGVTEAVTIGVLMVLPLYMVSRTKEIRGIIGSVFYMLTCVLSILDLAYYLYAAERYRGWERQGLSPLEVYTLHAQSSGQPGELKIILSTMYTYLIELWAMKLAFLLLYSNLFVRLPTRKTKLLTFTAAYLVISLFICMVYTSVFCHPFSSNWSASANERCIVAYSMDVYVLYAAFHISSDILLVALPLTVLGSLKLRKAEKGAIVFVIFMGTLSVILSIIRTAVYCGIPMLPPLGVRTGAIAPIEICNAVIYIDALEKISLIVAYCLPSMKRLLQNIFLESAFSKTWSIFDSTLLSWISNSFLSAGMSSQDSRPDANPMELHISTVNDSQVQLKDFAARSEYSSAD